MTGSDGSAAGRTNFASFTVPQLCAKLYAGNPASVRAAGATWEDTASSLHEQANRLERRLSGFSDSWQGGAADQYKVMITDLVAGIRKVADTAFAMRNMDYEAADAMETARAQMPAPVDVPVLAPTTVALASAPIQVDAGTPTSVVMQIQQARANAIAAVQGQQQAVVASNAAQAQAIQVMQTLANSYLVARDSIPPSPTAQTAPTVTTTAFFTPNTSVSGSPTSSQPVTMPADGPWQISGDLSSPTPQPLAGGTTPTTPQPGSPLFGGMFTAGVAAASAAVFGRFGSVIPKVPAWANKNDNGGSGSSGSAAGSAAGSGAGAGAGAGAAGAVPKLGEKMAGGGISLGHAGGLGGVKGIGGGFGAGGVPSAAPSLLSAATSDGNLAAGVVGGAVGAAAAGPGTPMMPMMPMGGMGGGMGDMGGGRRIPPWLVETQDVWGESGAVSPTVIGEEPDLGGQHWLG